MYERIIFISGSAASGKSTLAKEIAKAIPSSFLLENDIIKNNFLCVRPTTQGQLLSLEEYLKNISPQPTLNQDIFGVRLDISPGNEFQGRHVRDQAYSCMIELARYNLALGKFPIYESLFPNQFQSGLAGKILGLFREEERALIHLYLPENILKKRMIERAERSKEYMLKDQEKLSSDAKWEEFLKKNPTIPMELEKFPHIKINSSANITECINSVLDYLKR